ncbi:hypothetical protein KA068_01045 [Candidatus Saccharibacteria bacterium]|nr:hypothetical protein [Candidatus Saccharibacteria bacterium]
MPAPTELSFDLSFYEPQLQVLQGDPTTRVVGSLGRMVACQEILGRPFQEFEDSQVAGIGIDRVSDIDVLGVSPDILSAARTAGDAAVDDLAFHDTDVSIEIENGVWLLRSADTDFEAPINTRLMEPVLGVIAGVEIVTLPILTHKTLRSLRERGTRKDRLTEDTIGYLLHTIARETGVIPRLDVDDLRPFQQLQTRLQLLRHTSTSGNTRHSTSDRHSE